MELLDQKQTLSAVVTRKQLVSAYLQIWKGGFKFTETQFDLIRMLVEEYLNLYEQGMRDPYLSESVLSTARFHNLRFKFKVKKQRMYNLKAELKKLNALVKHPDENYLTINPQLIPKKSITFNFELK
jgi:hypothetical protein